MAILGERKIIKLMREEYTRRLHEVMDESDVYDSRGNMVLGKDLKVHHKSSGLEYTVADVEADAETGDVNISLRLPDEPRVEPPGEVEDLGAPPDPAAALLGEDDVPGDGVNMMPGDLSLPSKQVDPEQGTGEPDDSEVIFVIDQEEFEKEYEVK